MRTSTSFHVRHDFSPSVARDALLLLKKAPAQDAADLRQRAREHDLELGQRQSPDKVIASLRDLGLVERSRATQREPICLTPLGRRLAEYAEREPLLLPELIHQRYCWLWSDAQGGAIFSWAYQTVVKTLWEDAPAQVESDRLVAIIIAAAEQRFDVGGVSFSASSVLGILHWLRALRPACLTGALFQRRPACPPEALVVALEGDHAARGRSVDVPLRLDTSTRARVCRATLLDEAAFDDVMSLAEESLGIVRRQGDGGELLLLRQPLVPGLIPLTEEP